MEVCNFVKVTNAINHANFDGCMLRGLISTKGKISAFPIGSRQHCLALLRCHVMGMALEHFRLFKECK
jgi:hypothetical protein